MKILMVTSRFAPYSGGVERHLAGVCSELQAMGHHVDVLTFQGLGVEKVSEGGEKKYEKPSRETVEGGVRVFRLLGSEPSRNGQLQAAAWALQHARLLKTYDIIHGHDLVFWALQRFAPKARRYLTFHGYEAYPVSAESKERKLAMQASVQGAICAGSFIERWFGVTCDVVEWGAYTPPTKVSPITSDYCFVGRLAEDTGCREYVEALVAHLKSQPTLRTVVCGDGPLRSQLEDFAKDVPITFTGTISNPSDYIAGTGVVLTSGYLGMLEALYAEKPVVAFAGNPLKEDYVRSAPYAADISIATSAPELLQALVQAPKRDTESLKRGREFAEASTYPALAGCYINLWETK
jgi:glycosyltransferase involved in cell wall biosynthesis